MNLLIITNGRLGKDPETKSFSTGTSKTTFSVATSHRYIKDGEKKEETEWFNIECWGKTGETIAKWFQKGSRINLTGRIKTDEYQDKAGEKKRFTRVMLDTFEFVDSAKERPAAADNEFSSQMPEVQAMPEQIQDSSLPF